MTSPAHGFRIKYLALALMLVFGGYTVGSWPGASSAQAPPPEQAPSFDHLLNAVLFMQTAAEYRALTYQAYNVARQSLDRDLSHKSRDRRQRAVVVDIDETLLDNSPYQGWQILYHRNFSDPTWFQWSKRAEARAIPGAVDFLNYAFRRGVKVFYVSNRNARELEFTKKNLSDLGFPDVSDATVKLKEGSVSSKEPRRLDILKQHRIVLLVGDNLNDLAQVFEGGSIDERYKAVDGDRARFGADYIVIPNAMYGEWENAVYDYKSGLSPADRTAIRLQRLRAFTP